MKPSRNNRGVAHENGAIESAPRHLKDRVRGELELRRSREFECLEAYRTFVADIVARENVRVAKDIETERGQLNPLPPSNPCDCEEVMVTVTSTAGCRIRKVCYSVPSRLIGYRIKARIFDDRIELFQGETRIETLPHGHRTHRPNVIDYRHVIQSLKRKPMALERLTYRHDLFPRAAYRHFFDQVKESVSKRQACRLTVDFLALAHGCEAGIADAIEASLQNGSLPDVESLRTRIAFQELSILHQDVAVVNLGQYSNICSATASRHDHLLHTVTGRRSQPTFPHALRIATALHRGRVADPGSARRQGGLAGVKIPLLPRRTRIDRKEQPAPQPTYPAGQTPPRQEPRRIRFQPHSVPAPSTRSGLRLRRQLDPQGSQPPHLRPPGVGKSHLASAIGLSLVRQGLKVLFTGNSSLVQKMQIAQRHLDLDGLLARLHKFHLLILDDFVYVNLDREESAVLFELISYRYEQRSILLTANLPFAQWNRTFPD